MQFLNHIYSIPVLFGHRILIPLKDLYFTKEIFTANALFESEHTYGPSFKD